MSDTPVIGHYINGAVSTQAERFSDVFNPAEGVVQGRVAQATAQTVDQAVAAAKAAFPEWSEQSALRRARILFRFKELLDQHHRELAALITREHGKVLSDAMGEVTRGIEVVEFACGAPHLAKTSYSDNIGGGIDNWNLRQPLGVCAGITPFNFPVMVPLWMIPMALATGNTFILKPSERDPSASLLLAELLKQAGLPDGVFNVVQGDKVAVDRAVAAPGRGGHLLCRLHPHRRIHPPGRHPPRQARPGPGRCQEPHDRDARRRPGPGRRCPDRRRLRFGRRALHGHLHCRGVGEVVMPDRETAAAHRLPCGCARRGSRRDMGPLVTGQHKAKVEGYITKGVEEGARLLVDGRNFKVPGAEHGFFVGATLFDGVTPEMTIYREEIFGPVLGIVRVPDFASAVELINAHEFGNGVSCFTRDGGIARAFARTIKVGMVGINVPIPVPMAWHSFGGWKRSLFGDHHAYGEEGLRFYTRYKSVMQRWPDSIAKGAEFSMPTAK